MSGKQLISNSKRSGVDPVWFYENIVRLEVTVQGTGSKGRILSSSPWLSGTSRQNFFLIYFSVPSIEVRGSGANSRRSKESKKMGYTGVKNTMTR